MTPAATPGPPLLEVEGLHAHYGRAHILHGVSLSVGRGEVVALTGRNGAGKSTTLKAIMGLVPPTRGRVRFAGRDTAGLEPFEVARLGLGYVPEDRRVFTELTVLENLEVGAKPGRGEGRSWTPERLFELFPPLGRMRDRPGGAMSGGEQQMLAVARTLRGNPSLLLLDEPFEGLAPIVVEELAAALLSLKSEGLAVLLAEQGAPVENGLADRAVWLERGVVAAEPGA